MTVFDNVAFGLRVKPRKQRPPESEIKRKVHELLQLVQLDWLADRYPPQLSGGQRQRIALARALAVEPRVLLLDEPFGALDAKVRKELRRWLRRLHDELHITSIFVTHDQEEALELADRVVVMNHGVIEQIGTPEEIYTRPANRFVAEFLGIANFVGTSLAGRVLEHRLRPMLIAMPALTVATALLAAPAGSSLKQSRRSESWEKANAGTVSAGSASKSAALPVSMVSLPPWGMASRALTARFITAVSSWLLSARTIGRSRP